MESGLQAIERGEEVINLNLEIVGSAGKQEFDIITKTKLIECKNWTLNAKVPDVAITELKNALKPKKIIADSVDKKLILHSKNTIPLSDEFNGFKKWLLENEIYLIEG